MKYFLSVISAIMVLLVSCSKEPTVGEWYEHIPTKERVKVEFVGDGFAVGKKYLWKLELAKEHRDKMVHELDSLNTLLFCDEGDKEWRLKFYNEDLEECALWDVGSSDKRYVVVNLKLFHLKLFSLEKFNADFARILR
ncbi:MAG: hypothetical protein C0417_08560 [Chlorobiaceae bacterium]|nr:hypothetical protein [Chlorobiaceae bacterium]